MIIRLEIIQKAIKSTEKAHKMLHASCLPHVDEDMVNTTKMTDSPKKKASIWQANSQIP